MNTKSFSGRVVYYEDGEIIFKENLVNTELYVIESGKVELSKIIAGERIIIAILEEGNIFGEAVIFKDIPQDITAAASGKTTLLAFSIEELLQLMRTNLQFTINILQSLMSRLRDTTLTLANLINRINKFSDAVKSGLIAEKRFSAIGGILIEMGCLTKIQLERALQKQKEIHLLKSEHKLLGEIMVELGMITEDQLRLAMAKQRMLLQSRSE